MRTEFVYQYCTIYNRYTAGGIQSVHFYANEENAIYHTQLKIPSNQYLNWY